MCMQVAIDSDRHQMQIRVGAAGLNAQNVAAAIMAVKPFGVDLCSGVRTDGALDESKLTTFVAAMHGG